MYGLIKCFTILCMFYFVFSIVICIFFLKKYFLFKNIFNFFIFNPSILIPGKLIALLHQFIRLI